MSKKQHWENIFSTKTEKEVSWYQEYPKTSVDLAKSLQLPLDAKIIDIGGGDSYFIDTLLELGYTNLYLLDISENAIEKVKKRLGSKVVHVTFIETDILDFKPTEQFDFWHDRACFHFLTNRNEIERYATIVTKALAHEGQLALATFSDKGPLKCSGLEIKQYNMESLRLVFEKDFKLTGCFTEDHKTPFDTMQNFLFCTFQKK